MAIDAPFPAIPPVAQPPPSSLNPGTGAILIPEPPDRWTALKKIGWWKPVDYVFILLAMLPWITGFFWSIFASPGAAQLVSLFLCSITVLLVWTVVLVYRCMDFVVQLRANIEMLPFDSARIAVGFMQGGQQ